MSDVKIQQEKKVSVWFDVSRKLYVCIVFGNKQQKGDAAVNI